MQPQCITAVEQHLSAIRSKPVRLTESDVARINQEFNEAAKVIARSDRAAWQSMTPEERTVAAGQWVMNNKAQEALSVKATKLSQSRALVRGLQSIGPVAAKMEKAGKPVAGRNSKALVQYLRGVDTAVRGAEHNAAMGFGQMLEGVKSNIPFSSRAADSFYGDVMREIEGANTGNQQAKDFAAQWSGNMDSYREISNRNGGTIGKLDSYYPQVHNPSIMQRVGRDSWVQFMMQNMNRDKYMDDAGRVLNDAEMEKVIGDMYNTIITDGNVKIKGEQSGVAEMPEIAGALPGGRGGSNVAKRYNSQHREILLKDADAAIAYNAQFNDKALGAIFSDHMTNRARESAMITQMGANPDNTFDALRNTTKMLDTREGLANGYDFNNGEVKGATVGFMSPDAYYRHLAGGFDDANVFDRISSNITAYQAATKLTSTAIRAPFQDFPGMMMNMADTGQMRNSGTILKLAFLGKKELQQYGINAESNLVDMRAAGARISSQGGGFSVGNLMTRSAAATMKYTLLDKWTDVTRRSGQTAHAFAMAEWGKTPWAALDDSQRSMLGNAGMTAQDWALVNQMPVQQLRGVDIHDLREVNNLPITPDEKHNLYSKMAGFIRYGGDMTTSEHNFVAGALMSGGGRATGVSKQVMLFKNAGAAQTAHLMERMGRTDAMGKVGIIAATASLNALFGYGALSAMALTSGQDLPDPTDIRTLGKAIAVGGGFAFFADLITSASEAVSGSNAGHSSSPIAVLSDLAGVGRIAYSAATGDTSDAAYRSIKLARQQVPFMNYWYTKAAFDHMFFNDAAEAANPGYNKRLRKYADQKGQQYFWDPQGGVRAPGVGEYTKSLQIMQE